MLEINAPRTVRVGGWLAVLCFLLVVWEPISLGLVVSNGLSALSIRGVPAFAMFVVRIAVTAFGLAAGYGLIRGLGAAVAMAKTALFLSAGVDLIVYTTSFLPSNRMPGDTPLYVAASLAYHAVWIAYLYRSRRVREMFGD